MPSASVRSHSHPKQMSPCDLYGPWVCSGLRPETPRQLTSSSHDIALASDSSCPSSLCPSIRVPSAALSIQWPSSSDTEVAQLDAVALEGVVRVEDVGAAQEHRLRGVRLLVGDREDERVEPFLALGARADDVE